LSSLPTEGNWSPGKATTGPSGDVKGPVLPPNGILCPPRKGGHTPPPGGPPGTHALRAAG